MYEENHLCDVTDVQVRQPEEECPTTVTQQELSKWGLNGSLGAGYLETHSNFYWMNFSK